MDQKWQDKTQNRELTGFGFVFYGGEQVNFTKRPYYLLFNESLESNIWLLWAAVFASLSIETLLNSTCGILRWRKINVMDKVNNICHLHNIIHILTFFIWYRVIEMVVLVCSKHFEFEVLMFGHVFVSSSFKYLVVPLWKHVLRC